MSGGLSLSHHKAGERRGSPWTVCQSVTWEKYRQTAIHTPNMHVFGLWVETREPRGNPSMQAWIKPLGGPMEKNSCGSLLTHSLFVYCVSTISFNCLKQNVSLGAPQQDGATRLGDNALRHLSFQVYIVILWCIQY